MGTDTYLKAHTGPEFDFDNDGDAILAWRKNDVPMSWLMFFHPDDRATAKTEHPDLTTDLTTATARYRNRLATYQDALNDFAPAAEFETLLTYVETLNLARLTLGTWELWINDLPNFTTAFERALNAVAQGPASPDWGWMLTWCHPPNNWQLEPHALFGHGGGRPRPWLTQII